MAKASGSWELAGSGGQPIYGDCHDAVGQAVGVALVAHGFKGYKDYGMFPAVTAALARTGLVAHRFNFSHSGMTNRIETFERPDLFERDTWNRQAEDLLTVARAVETGTLHGAGLPQVWFGHSRGGVTVLLAAGRVARDGTGPDPAGLITAAAPSRCNSLDADQSRALLERGFLESPSSRTGQTLRVGSGFLQEQLDDPADHDLLELVARIDCPLLVVHGQDDPTVPVAAADELAHHAQRGRRLVIQGADHVFNTPNPFPLDATASPQLRQLIEAATGFARECATTAGTRS
ncbi:MAG: alpha/beta hydrolase [Planctomycetota bacterium]|jgi:pimeloyl-ACP methyl ester carboxylesterase